MTAPARRRERAAEEGPSRPRRARRGCADPAPGLREDPARVSPSSSAPRRRRSRALWRARSARTLRTPRGPLEVAGPGDTARSRFLGGGGICSHVLGAAHAGVEEGRHLSANAVGSRSSEGAPVRPGATSNSSDSRSVWSTRTPSARPLASRRRVECPHCAMGVHAAWRPRADPDGKPRGGRGRTECAAAMEGGAKRGLRSSGEGHRAATGVGETGEPIECHTSNPADPAG